MLTNDQRRALAHAARGLSSAEVAEALGVTTDEARALLAGAALALGARSKLEAVVLAVRAGLVRLG
jgi:DNA-binding CsgD family transcriptional regulator